MKKTNENASLVKDMLNEKGPGFCLAKWTQVTLHLGVGLNHSCHHPKTHEIPLDEIKDNVNALHNSSYKKSVRKQMLNGQRPAECDYCWRIEDNTEQFSDRVYKSIEPWSYADMEKIKSMSGDEDVYPRHVEISFSNICNFKCSYCGPEFSSKWVSEINKYGPYKLPSGMHFNPIQNKQILERQENPYIDAFWKWWPEAVKHMHTLRVTGGEPLMSKHTMHVIDHLLENPQPELEFHLNTNGNPPDNIFIEFTKKVQLLIDNNCIKRFVLFTSAESHGKQAEFSRDGLDWNKFTDNIEYFLKNTRETQVVFMCAFNILSLPSFKQFLEYTKDLKTRYNKNFTYGWLQKRGFDFDQDYISRLDGLDHRVLIDTPYVRHPNFLDSNMLTMELASKYLLPAINYMFANKMTHDWHGQIGFEEWECQKFKRIVLDLVNALHGNVLEEDLQADTKIAKQRADFYNWTKMYKERRGMDLLDYIPEFENFIKVCESEAKKLYG